MFDNIMSEDVLGEGLARLATKSSPGFSAAGIGGFSWERGVSAMAGSRKSRTDASVMKMATPKGRFGGNGALEQVFPVAAGRVFFVVIVVTGIGVTSGW